MRCLWSSECLKNKELHTKKHDAQPSCFFYWPECASELGSISWRGPFFGVASLMVGFVFLGWGLMLAFTSVFTASAASAHCRRWSYNSVVRCSAVRHGLVDDGQDSRYRRRHHCRRLPWKQQYADLDGRHERGAGGASYRFRAAYSILRFIGGAIAPYLAGKLAEWFNPRMPFVVGGDSASNSKNVYVSFYARHSVLRLETRHAAKGRR